MLPYYIAYVLMISVGIWSNSNLPGDRAVKKRNYCVIWAVIWIFLLGCRHPSMGVDLQYGGPYGYLGQFPVIAGLSWEEILRWNGHYELGYVVFNKLLGYIGTADQVLLFACAFLVIGMLAFVISRNSDYPFLSSIICVGLPFFLMSFSGLRQILSVSITFLSYELIREKRYVRFGLMVLLAMGFHSSAWIFIFAYPLYHLRMRRMGKFLTLIFPVVVYIFRYPLFAVLSPLFKVSAEPDNNHSVTLFAVYYLICVFVRFFGRFEDGEEEGWSNLFLAACCCQSFAGVYSTAARVGFYFSVYLVLLLPRVVKNFGGTSTRTGHSLSTAMYLVILGCFCAFGLYSLGRDSWAMSNPYLFFWQV